MIEEYNDPEAAFEHYYWLVETWLNETPSEDDHYFYLNANNHASGILWEDNIVVHIYDCNGEHNDTVNDILNDLQELV